MTRERQINIAASKYIEDNSVGGEVCISSHKDSFIEGAEWADANPKSPWISVKDDLPCNHKEMVKVVIEDADTYTDRVLAMTNEGMVTIAYMYKFDSWLWYWSETERITHWMPIPKLEED